MTFKYLQKIDTCYCVTMMTLIRDEKRRRDDDRREKEKAKKRQISVLQDKTRMSETQYINNARIIRYLQCDRKIESSSKSIFFFNVLPELPCHCKE